MGKPVRLVGKVLQNLTLTRQDGFKLGGKKVWGAVQAKILPPKSKFLPLLPAAFGGKLKFALCKKCVENMSTKLCKHSDKDRALVSTWTSIEIEFAVLHGYRVLKIYEFFVYEKTLPLFRRFYTRLARIKLEAEGFPSNVVTDGEKKTYVDRINKRMPGLGLKVANVQRNPGRRAFAKLMSNAGLGKTKNALKPKLKPNCLCHFRKVLTKRPQGQRQVRVLQGRVREPADQFAPSADQERHPDDRVPGRGRHRDERPGLRLPLQHPDHRLRLRHGVRANRDGQGHDQADGDGMQNLLY